LRGWAYEESPHTDSNYTASSSSMSTEEEEEEEEEEDWSESE
jgi:hypothetical protein